MCQVLGYAKVGQVSRVVWIQVRHVVEPPHSVGVVPQSKNTGFCVCVACPFRKGALKLNVNGHSQEFEEVVDSLVSVEQTRSWYSDPPCSPLEVPATNPDWAGVGEAQPKWLADDDQVHGDTLV